MGGLEARAQTRARLRPTPGTHSLTQHRPGSPSQATGPVLAPSATCTLGSL